MFFAQPENWASGFVEGKDAGYTVGGFWVTWLVPPIILEQEPPTLNVDPIFLFANI